MTDPRYPGRPEHPDFWLISQGLIEQDAQAEGGQAFGRYVDLASLTYVAEQRALRLYQADRRLVYGAVEVQTRIAAAWMDAFIQGIRFEHLKQQQEES